MQMKARIHAALGLAILAAAIAAPALALNPRADVVAQLRTTWILARPDQEPAPGSKEALYPPAARRAGLEGQAVLRCPVQADGSFPDCAVVEEDPKGAGFGEAALALVTHLRQPIPDPRGGVRDKGFAIVPFFFGEIDPRMTPDVVEQLVFERKPTELDIRRYLSKIGPGSGIVSCRTQADGSLANCQAVTELLWGYWVKQDMLKVVPLLRLRTTLKDGRPLPVGAIVRVPIVFQVPTWTPKG